MNLEANLTRLRPIAASGGSDLAHLPPFRLGPLTVEPGLRRLIGLRGEARTIQPLAMRVLLVLADARGETSSRDDLVEACWNQRIVGDDAVHRIISTLRRDLAQLSGGAVGIETIPKVGYRLQADRSDASREDCAIAGKQPDAKQVYRRKAFATLAVCGVMLAGALSMTTMRRSAEAMTVAVVPERAGAAPFADGLTSELARAAATMPSLSFIEPGAVARRSPLVLRVALEPGNGGEGARVRLVTRDTGAVIWSRAFPAITGPGASLRERVAFAVAGVVQCGLERSASPFEVADDLRLYLGACDAVEMGDWPRAHAFAEQIATRRPDAANSWACLAIATILAAEDGDKTDPGALRLADSYVSRALELDASSGFAYAALAMVRERQGLPVIEVLERGIRYDPDRAGLHLRYALALARTGYAQRGVEPALRAVALQPHFLGMHQGAVIVLRSAGRIAEANEIDRRVRRLWPRDEGVSLQSAYLLAYASDPRQALQSLDARQLPEIPPVQLLREVLEWRAAPSAYNWKQFDDLAERQTENDPNSAWSLAYAAARMGDVPRAIKWLERAPANSPRRLLPQMFAPEAVALRRDPRFFAKMASLGLVDYWRQTGRWPDFCGDPDLPYNCRARAAEWARLMTQGTKNGGRTRART